MAFYIILKWISVKSKLVSHARNGAQIKLNIQNIGERAVRGAQAALEKEALKTMQQAMDFAPLKDGPLSSPLNWEMRKAADGINGRNTFTVRLKEGAIARRRKSKNGTRVVYLREYARLVHDGVYNLGENSKKKAARLGYSFSPVSGGKYVGRLYLTRAANIRRLPTHRAVLEATKRALS